MIIASDVAYARNPPASAPRISSCAAGSDAFWTAALRAAAMTSIALTWSMIARPLARLPLRGVSVERRRIAVAWRPAPATQNQTRPDATQPIVARNDVEQL